MEKRKRTQDHNKFKTLGEKLQEHYEKRNFEPKESSITIFAMSFVWINTITLVLEGLLLLLPAYHTDVNTGGYTIGYKWAQRITIWLFLETMCQWWLLRNSDRDIVRKDDKIGSKHLSTTRARQGWRWCSTCKLAVHPRSHHCTTCNLCIMKRDHHCYFSGSCVGFNNQRNFLLFLLYVTLACVYAVCMQFHYLWTQENLTYFIPFVAMWKTVTRQSSMLSLFVLIHLFISLLSLFGSVSFIAWQLKIIINGQTSYEAKKGTNDYNKSVYENLRNVFGSEIQFLLSVLIPIRLTLPEEANTPKKNS